MELFRNFSPPFLNLFEMEKRRSFFFTSYSCPFIRVIIISSPFSSHYIMKYWWSYCFLFFWSLWFTTTSTSRWPWEHTTTIFIFYMSVKPIVKYQRMFQFVYEYILVVKRIHWWILFNLVHKCLCTYEFVSIVKNIDSCLLLNFKVVIYLHLV